MARLVVLVEARDRPGLLHEVLGLLREAGGNVVGSFGYTSDGLARILLVVDIPKEPWEVEELLSQVPDADVQASSLGPGVGELVARFLRERPRMVTSLEACLEPPDLLDGLLRLPRDVRRSIYPLLDTHVLAELLRLADEATVEEIASTVPLDRLAKALEMLDVDDLVDVLQKMPQEVSRKLLQKLPRELRSQVSRLMAYPPETAGGVMTTSVPVLGEDKTVADALALLRSGRFEVRDTIVVVDAEGRLVGLVPTDELLRVPPTTRLRDLVLKPRVTVEPDVDREEAARLMLRYDVKRLPVVDSRGRFLGIIAIEDVADILAEEAAEDIALLGGSERPRERYIRATIGELVKRRILWLVAIYLVESVTANIIKAYEPLIQRVAVIAAFMPLIMDTGGNVGSQASSMIIRALALGEVSERSRYDLLLVMVRELAVALAIGVSMAALGFLFAYTISSSIAVALAVAAALLLVIIFADLLGSLLPIVARRLGVDPAVLSSPLITTVVDVCVVFIYLGLSSLLLLG